MSDEPFPLLIFAAGFGTRMGALTATRPKPLIPVAGKPLIDHAFEVARAAGVARPVVNLHYLGDQIEAHLKGRPALFSWERPQILETGGGLRAALPLLGQGPAMVLNSDVVWTGQNPLRELMSAWDDDKMDALLLLLPVAEATGHGPRADFTRATDGRLARATGTDGHVYIGASILRTDVLFEIEEPAFSLNRPWDRLIAKGRAFGVVHHGGWCDVGHPEGIAIAEALLRQQTDG
jgi:N-acetyl-alpha-D-muramate 1-phosphate uridylyltransferase